ncbi:MAG: MFS transporter [Actinomycetota bacterium]
MDVRGLRRRLYVLSFVDEFGPVYAVYTLFFADNGVSTPQISIAFLLWAVFALVLEVPSGALGDLVDRRRLIAGAFALRAIAISVWLVWPTFSGLIVGTLLFALHDALASGTWEAMIHDELTAVGESHRYGEVIARTSQWSNLGVAAGTLSGAGLLAIGTSLEALGWVTVLVHAGSITLVLALPAVRWGAAADGDPDDGVDLPTGLSGWWWTLRRGTSEVRADRTLRRLVLLGSVFGGLFLLDEYLPLLSRARGGSDEAAPWIVLVVWIGLLVGDEIAARRAEISGRVLGPLLVASMAVTTVAFVSDEVWALALVAVGYAALEANYLVADARLQAATSGAARATVSSVRGLGMSSISMMIFAVIALLADGDDPTPGLYVMVALLAVSGVVATRWIAAGPPTNDSSD